ncbi:MAG TPA: helix-turn-helix domain-containing protein [Candidatus Caldiarchaeum subterraneum]|uniref:Helix-turn-helix domain-containing protein n=1 Tax=Caldiarchaeum subterraneum TaxID=311458 RepID=A0A833EBW8_CALS0|nr:helix-turn-helix domain-containing protein [Aigarchaeota archaeon]HIQ29255.1 helix-turn-helix domain-containing protein [Candidatus Caldarchaeum subterraneum]
MFLNNVQPVISENTVKSYYRDIVYDVVNRIAGEVILSKHPGEVLKKWRMLFEISQTELAHAMGVSPSVLSDYEKNRRQSPGVAFIRRYVNSLIEIDLRRGGVYLRKFSTAHRSLDDVILAISEFTSPKTAGELAEAIDGVWLAGEEYANDPVYGYTVIDSLMAIVRLDANDFLRLFGQNSMRLVIFTNVERGRSPMIAVRIYPIKPKMVAIHGPKSPEEVDKLGIELARRERIPYVLSQKRNVKNLIDSLSMF